MDIYGNLNKERMIIMEKLEGYDSAVAITGEYERLSPRRIHMQNNQCKRRKK